MTPSLQHAFAPEEVMAYLDGALAPERASALAAHLHACMECQNVAADFRQLSDRLLLLEIEPAPESLNGNFIATLSDRHATTVAMRKSVWSRFWNAASSRPTRTGWVATCALALVVVLIAASRTHLVAPGLEPVALNKLASYHPDATPLPAARGKATATSADKKVQAFPRDRASLAESLENDTSTETRESNYVNDTPEPDSDQLAAPDVAGPMIEQTVSLHIVPSNYDDASASIEKLAASHGGYVANLNASAQAGSARDVSVELRIPAKQAAAFLADARKLGRIVEETRSTEEVTAQYVDLQARLKAAKAAEQRLVEILGTRTGRLSDVLDVERELARVRSEIESMQGETNVLLHQVNYATVKVELSEEYRETLRNDGSFGSKLRNACVNGFKNLEDGITGALVFLLEDGLSLAFWGGLLLGAAYLVWKRIKARRSANRTAH